jgi:O-antigen/teichoic acid export membrane protein
MYVAGIGDAWIPFGATAIGLAASMAVGLASAGELSDDEPLASSSTRALVRVGRPLLPAALVQEATVFAGSAILVGLTSAATLGTAEAARIVSRPVQAFSLGISRSLAPRLMESGQSRSPEVAKSAAGLYAVAIAIAGLGYMAVAGWAYPHSPMVRLLPAAYEAQGLVALFLLATSLGAIAQIPRAILLGAGEGRTILAITTATSAVRLTAVALLAGMFGAYAPPAAQLLSLNVTGWAETRAAMQLMKRGQVALTCRHVSPS